MSRRLRRRFGVVAAVATALALTLTGVAVPAVAAVSTNTSCTSMTLEQARARILADVNAARATAGVAALTSNPFMDDVAATWSQAQASAAGMSHNPDYSKQIPPGWTSASENVAYGYPVTGVMTAWMNSDGHRANILRAASTHIGIGVACSAAGSPYYTQVFGGYDRTPGTTAAPVSPKAAAGTASATVSWSTSTYSGAQAITSFTVTASPGGATATATGSARSAVVTGLTPGVSYTFKVTATNSYGVSPASAATAAVVPTGSSSSAPAAAGARIAGADRFATSAAISAEAFSPGVAVAYLTSGDNFPDALSGTSAAGAQSAPVLLVSPDAIPSAIRTELTRLKPKRIVVLGGTGTVSDAVLAGARSYTSGTVTRLSGADRYATSASISAATFPRGVSVVYLASGADFPDALAAGAAAAQASAPVLLVQPGTLPTAVRTELERLKPGRIVVLGGATSISDAVMKDAARYATSGATRIAGADRYGTSAAVSASVFSPGVKVVYLASGQNFPDALSGGPAAALKDSPVLLTAPTSLPTAVRAELERLKPQRIVILGGSSSVSDAVLAAAQGYAKG